MKSKLYNSVFSLALMVSLLLPSVAFSQAGPCPSQTCVDKRKKIDAVCHTVGGLVYFELPDGSMCYCKCSCLEGNTPVEISEGVWNEISNISVGDNVLAMRKDGKWVDATVTFSDGTVYSQKPIYFAIYLELKDNIELVVTPDHLFLTPSGTLKRADRLSPEDKLVDANKKPVEILKIVPGKYKGSFHNIAVSDWDLENVNIDGHLINTKGIISGDFYLQSVLKGGEVGEELPQIGSIPYRSKNQKSFEMDAFGFRAIADSIKFSEKDVFIPYKPVDIPDDAIHFLPEDWDDASFTKLAPLDASVPYEVAEYIVANYKRQYPNVIYHIDWLDNTVNAYAWMSGGKRHVALKGGIIRHVYMKKEGVGLVLAHELGHHFGGEPRYPGNPWASCEGQADYWGAMVAQRHVWWGPYAVEQIKLGSQQLYNLFAYGLVRGNLFDRPVTASSGLCSHPPASCRLETYRAGITLDDKPPCAGDPPPYKLLGSIGPEQRD